MMSTREEIYPCETVPSDVLTVKAVPKFGGEVWLAVNGGEEIMLKPDTVEALGWNLIRMAGEVRR